ncbi:MAG TPA: hypothetical protein VJ617_06360 [Arthrobacter sp.]|nr:hypothetical protein [Arthrobacter sp.]
MPTPAEALFIAFGLGSQAVLCAFFAARRWRQRLAARLGWLAYAIAGLGLPLAIWFLAEGESWRLYAGPLLLGLWALFGSYLDLWRRVEWRSPPKYGLLVPYVALYFWAQMFLWWPLLDLQRIAWSAFLVLFCLNTTLNLTEHFGRPAARRVNRRG